MHSIQFINKLLNKSVIILYEFWMGTTQFKEIDSNFAMVVLSDGKILNTLALGPLESCLLSFSTHMLNHIAERSGEHYYYHYSECANT